VTFVDALLSFLEYQEGISTNQCRLESLVLRDVKSGAVYEKVIKLLLSHSINV
jgi:hypothetical protein